MLHLQVILMYHFTLFLVQMMVLQKVNLLTNWSNIGFVGYMKNKKPQINENTT